jgi:ribonuclease P protein component
LRIKQRREFLRVQRGGRKHQLRHFLVFAARRVPAREGSDSNSTVASSSEPPTRLGITVTRKVGNAVARNHIKRMVREVFRQNRERLPSNLDLVWVAKQGAAEVDFAAVLADFEALLRRGELVSAPVERSSQRRARSR